MLFNPYIFNPINKLIIILKSLIFVQKITAKSCNFHICIFPSIDHQRIGASLEFFFRIHKRQYLICREKYEGSKSKIIKKSFPCRLLKIHFKSVRLIDKSPILTLISSPPQSYKRNFEKKNIFFSQHGLILYLFNNFRFIYHIYPTPPLGQDMTQGQFLSGV